VELDRIKKQKSTIKLTCDETKHRQNTVVRMNLKNLELLTQNKKTKTKTTKNNHHKNRD